MRGHRAYLAGGYVVWQYARGGWAWLSFPLQQGVPEPRDVVKVADHVRFGVAAAPSLVFPAQLTRVPRRWQVTNVQYHPDAGVLLGSQYSLTRGGGEDRANIPFLTIAPATSHSSCSYYPHGVSAREVIGGHHVIVDHIPAARGNQPEQQLCAARADGLAVFMSEIGSHPVIGVVTLFEHHLRLLGRDPANWTRSPIG